MIEYAGHAREYVQTIQLGDWSGIVLASGDGLVYEVNHFRIIFRVFFCLFEVINGLMSRNDWQEALKLPIGHVPCGSGNAFITNIIRYSK
jgi:sphingosine kinase